MGARSWIRMAALACPVLGVSASVAAADECPPGVGHIVSVDGQVELQPADGSSWQPAAVYQFLCQQDSVRTGPNSRAAVMLSNDAVLRLDQETTVHLVDIREG